MRGAALSVRAWQWARLCLLVGVGLAVAIMFLEGKLVYFPEPYPGGLWEVERIQPGQGEVFPRLEDAGFEASDGVKLHGWFCTPHRREGGDDIPLRARAVILWFHGNAGNITYRYDMVRRLMRIPARVLMVDYRGYGKSQGRPSEEGLYRDARGAWDHLVGERRIPPEQIVLLGKSLGGAVAIHLATQIRPAGLIVQSSFTSVPDMARTLIPFLPSFLLRTKMDSMAKIPRVSCPKLFVHSPADEIVPYWMGRRLLEAALEPKRFHEVPGAPHNETYIVGGEAYLDALGSFVRSCVPDPDGMN